MNIEDLVGFNLERCFFSKCSYTFEFDGFYKDKYASVLVSTSYHFSHSDKMLSEARDMFSHEVWGFLEKKVIAVSLEDSEQYSKIIFDFEGGYQFSIWSELPAIDNLAIITHNETGDWFSVF